MGNFFNGESDSAQIEIPRHLLFNAIRDGVSDAIWRIATNATGTPCSDFFEMIKEGMKEGMESLHTK